MQGATTRIYESPRLEVVGSVQELTLDSCDLIGKQLGSPDIWSFIPIEWCSSNGSV